MFEHLGFYKNSIKAYQQCRWFSNIFMVNFNKPIFKFFRNLERIYITYSEVFEEIQEKFEKNHQNSKSFLVKKDRTGSHVQCGGFEKIFSYLK